MKKNKELLKENNYSFNLIMRYAIFWPYFLISLLFFLASAYLYLRYADYQYEITSKIEIIDKSMDNEMALPTAMTIFNRSMINLENETGVLSSFALNSKVVNSTKFNAKLYTVGRLKATENHYSEWFNDYELEYGIDLSTAKNEQIFKIYNIENNLNIEVFDKYDNFLESYSFKGFSTYSKPNNLPFQLIINDTIKDDFEKLIQIKPHSSTVDLVIANLDIQKIGKESDQLQISIKHSNPKIGMDYLNKLMTDFDFDGISDRQLEYKRTIEFVDTRSKYLEIQLNNIESKKQTFKENNDLSDISMAATVNFEQQNIYDAELFEAESQKDLIYLLRNSIQNNDFKLMPINIGLKDSSINDLIIEYNTISKERSRYLNSAGPNNSFIKSLESQLYEYQRNVLTSISNYEESLNVTINNLKDKEDEFYKIFKNIPENEKILRSIERELQVIESLYLLLLQKREEAAINFAVVKPSIKIIDYARSSIDPVSPRTYVVYIFSFFSALMFPTLILSVRFGLDDKIHTKSALSELVDDIPIIGEVPNIIDKKVLTKISAVNSRTPLAESLRMVAANLNFVKVDNKKNNNVILVTSSVKGEGKTIISTNLASILSSKSNKVLLIGADLRNPQIHKFFELDKSIQGLSDYIYLENLKWKDLLIKNNSFDILLSGKIPPNPTQLLASNKFESFLQEVKSLYDYIIIDSAPCLLVSDTFEISKNVGMTIYVVRSNFSKKNLMDFVNESKNENKLNNINLILNCVGSSKSYGYKYGYQYGYQYGYNYGYGYGYKEDKN